MIAAAARLVSRYLLDLEIFGLGLDLSADAWKVSRQEGRNQRCKWIHANFRVGLLEFPSPGRQRGSEFIPR